MSRTMWQWSIRRAPSGARRRGRQSRPPKRRRPAVELLESRDLLSGFFHPTYVLLPGSGGGVHTLGSPGPTGYTPSQIRHAYGFDQITFSNGTVNGDGSGTTIAIVDAFDDPNIANDLTQFDATFGLPDPTFTKVDQNGGTNYPIADGGWASEIALDVEWSHAIAPKANILLVEANDNSDTNLLAAVKFAAAQPGVVAVSMSWGGGEFSTEASSDGNFTTPAGHAGVTFLASSGDSGAPPIWPAISKNVVSVGGTTLNLDPSGNILSESAWGGSGGGISAFLPQPSYQNGVVTQSTTKRTNPDVAYDADPNTGFPVYDSFNNGTATPWSQFGGTSDAAPQWAGLIAIADQGRALAGLGSLDGPSQTLPMLYSISAGDYHDITTGGNGTFSAGPGYDLVTGRGTPLANLVVADLVGSQSVQGATHFSVSAPSSSTAGSAFSVTVTALDGNGNTFAGYTGTVHFTSSDTIAGLPFDYTFTAADNGVHTFTNLVTLKTAGSQTVTVKDNANSSISGSATVSVSAAAATQLAFGQQPTNSTVGGTISPAVTVRVLDAYGNLVTTDNSDQVTVAIGSNPGGGTLSGTTTVTVSGGVATFNNLSIDQAGNGYTLTASSGALTGATSASFNVSTSIANLIEGFETTKTWFVTGSVTAVRDTRAAHDGTYGLDMFGNSGWIYRTDAAVQVQAGDTLSVWLQFNSLANGRAYFGFGASSFGTLSLVAAPNTGQLILQENLFYGFNNIGAVGQTYLANHWYRLEVDWGTSGTIVGKLFDSDGKTLLNTVTAASTLFTSGGIAFRATGNDKFFDTVTDTRGVNNFGRTRPAFAGGGPSLVGGESAGGAAPAAASARRTVGSALPAAAAAPAPPASGLAAPDAVFLAGAGDSGQAGLAAEAAGWVRSLWELYGLG
jgi:subtilase family serine protease